MELFSRWAYFRETSVHYRTKMHTIVGIIILKKCIHSILLQYLRAATCSNLIVQNIIFSGRYQFHRPIINQSCFVWHF